ncbi:MAG: chromosomal replication initiator protein DnaA [Bryobacterales bacterium]|nr:chromosomal replication initiator protein DnaA [Bryobacterales bacterium]
MDVWELIKQRLANQLTSESFHNWFQATRLSSHRGDAIWVSAPTEAAAAFIEQEYGALIQRVIEELRLPLQRVHFHARPEEPQHSQDSDGNPRWDAVVLNPRFRFETFVVGSCNQVAYAAAQAVAQRPGQVYNPLFIYAGSGLGKTHLLHALGWRLRENFPSLRVAMTSGERFINDMVRAIRQQRMLSFHRTYRSVDVLVMDDVHVVAGKDTTQEELFHTFNELHARQRQIVLSSDVPPREIPNLAPSLRTRFECGLTVAIDPPDLETKLSIIRQRAAEEGLQMPDEVKLFIASRTHSNVREIEGAVLRIQAVASVTRTPITLQMAQQALRDLLPSRERRVTLESIAKAVCAEFGLQPAQLRMRSNARQIVTPRQIAMYMARELTHASLNEIGKAFGGKHHTTVMHSINKIEKLRRRDQDLNRLIHRLMDVLQ